MQFRKTDSTAAKSLARRLISVLLICLGPILVWTAIIWIDELYGARPRGSRVYWFLPLALMPGLVGIWLQDLRKPAAAITVVAYAVVVLPVLLAVELVIVCANFGRCL